MNGEKSRKNSHRNNEHFVTTKLSCIDFNYLKCFYKREILTPYLGNSRRITIRE